MRWTEKQRQIAEEILKHRKDDTFDFKTVQAVLPGTAKSAISNVGKALRLNNWDIPSVPSTPAKSLSPVATAGGRPPILFEIAGRKIELEPEPLYQAHMLYEDLKHLGLDCSFSHAIFDSIAIWWKVLRSQPIVTEKGIKLEVKNEGPQ